MLNVQTIKAIHMAQAASLKAYISTKVGLSVDINDNVATILFQNDPVFNLHSDVYRTGHVEVSFSNVEKYPDFKLPTRFVYDLPTRSSTEEERRAREMQFGIAMETALTILGVNQNI